MSQLFVMEGAAGTWQEALKLTADMLLEKGCVRDDFYDSCVLRELSYPTGLTASCPIAIPHTTKDFVLQQAVCVLRLKQPVRFRSMENIDQEIPVRYVLNLALLDDQEHILVISRIIKNLKNRHFLEAMDALPEERLGQFLETKFLQDEGDEQECG